MLWPQGNRPTSRWTIPGSGHAAAKARMYSRLVRDSPVISGNSARRSDENRWITLVPHPSAA